MNGKIMKGFAASLAGLLLIACAGCGGGGGGSSSAAPSQSATATQKAVTINAQGDSTMWGYVAPHTQATPTAPGKLESLLQARFGARVTVNNNGRPGSRIDERISGGNTYYTEPLVLYLTKDTSQIVIGNWAINDAAFATLDDYKKHLNEFITDVQQAGKIAVLEEPNPICAESTAQPDNFVIAMREVSAARGVLLIEQYDYIKSLPNWKSMMTDCLHPGAALYAIKGQREYDALAPLVAKMR
jgi:acyl-CoA thioesterase-1